AHLQALSTQTTVQMAQVTRAVKSGSQTAAATASLNFGKFATSVEQAMGSSAVSTGKGVQLIAQALNSELVALGASKLPQSVIKNSSVASLLQYQQFATQGAAGGSGGGVRGRQ